MMVLQIETRILKSKSELISQLAAHAYSYTSKHFLYNLVSKNILDLFLVYSTFKKKKKSITGYLMIASQQLGLIAKYKCWLICTSATVTVRGGGVCLSGQ